MELVMEDVTPFERPRTFFGITPEQHFTQHVLVLLRSYTPKTRRGLPHDHLRMMRQRLEELTTGYEKTL